MAALANFIGVAGSGKTTALMDVIDKLIADGVSPWEIGFCSFTRAARANAVSRAASRFDMNPKDLEKQGWFKTLHAICYRVLEMHGDRCLTKGKETRAWFTEHFGEEVESDEEFGSFTGTDKSNLELALNLWNVNRQRLESFDATHERAELAGTILPDIDECRDLIDRYEQLKRLDDKSDFTDWLGLFSGTLFNLDRHSTQAPRGDVPELAAWCLDEQQDNSALMDKCFRRLVEPSGMAYVAGDPFQSVYGFSGSDHKLFQGWDYLDRKILNQSYRCSSEILDLGEACLRQCSDYWDRKAKPVSIGGEIYRGLFGSDGLCEIENYPDETWLLLARSNYYARRFVPHLLRMGVPYTLTRGGSPWDAPQRNGALYALLLLQQGRSITELEWFDVLKLDGLPVKFREVEMLVKGTKSEWKKRELAEDSMNDLVGLESWGATQSLCEIIESGKWVEFFEFAPALVDAIERYGQETVFAPKVKISTCHSAKGMEADNVIILDSVSQIVHNAMQEPDAYDEECRLAYVAVTRARQRLWIVSDRKARYRMEIPA